jgi:hypothetical protein
MNRNLTFFIDLLRLMPNEAWVSISCYDDEVLEKLRGLGLQKPTAVPLTKRPELIKLLVCEDVLVDFVHIEIRQADRVFFNAYDRMLFGSIHKPVELPPHFIRRYELVEYDLGWEFKGSGFDGLEQRVLALE